MVADPQPGTRTRGRKVMAASLGAISLFWVALAAWGLSSPTGSSPDEEYHLAHIYCAAGEATCTPEGERVYPCFAWNPTVTGDCEAREIQPVSPALRLHTEPMGGFSAPPAAGISEDRPMLYPRIVSVLVTDTLADTTVSVRLLNAALAVGMAGASILLSRRRIRTAVALGWVVASVPLGMFIVASVNLSSWAIVGIAAFWGPLVSFLLERRFDRVSVARILFTSWAVVMAIGARNDSPIYIGFVLLAVLTLTMPRHPTVPQRWRLLLPVGLGLLCAGVFAIVTSGRAEYVATGIAPPTVPATTYDVLLSSVTIPLDALVRPLLGWLDTPMPSVVNAAAVGVFAGVVLVGAGLMYRRKAVALLLLMGLMVGFILVLGTRMPLNLLQPRYFLPVLMVVAGVALLPSLRGPVWMPTKVQTGAILAVLTAANSVALLTNLQRYIVGYDGTLLDPATLATTPEPEWWWNSLPLTPFALWLVGSVGFAAAAGVLWWLLLVITTRAVRPRRVVDLRARDRVAVQRQS